MRKFREVDDKSCEGRLVVGWLIVLGQEPSGLGAGELTLSVTCHRCCWCECLETGITSLYGYQDGLAAESACCQA